ncbi:hypothetical protein KAT36_01015 [Candidatus Pacearchaeota archaeon]|nr:hypothetical protein [Candidatus Pacearchaeota archaeon]
MGRTQNSDDGKGMGGSYRKMRGLLVVEWLRIFSCGSVKILQKFYKVFVL